MKSLASLKSILQAAINQESGNSEKQGNILENSEMTGSLFALNDNASGLNKANYKTAIQAPLMQC